MSSYDEPENHIIFDIRFKATNADANDVWILLSCMQDWREYDRLDDLLRHGTWELSNRLVMESMQAVTRRHTELRSLCSQHVRDLIRAKGIDA